MESFVVSARKYRPQTFDTVVGQSHITVTLKNAIRDNHLAQSFLFCGPRGVGKTTCARILAKTINCQNPTAETEACNECTSCKSFNASSSLNVYELDAASNNSVDDIRSLTDQVRYPPQSCQYKIYIIDEAHMLSGAAFNAFLKTLEEPPSYAIFILATTEKHKIIPTILSRCQTFDFNRLQIPEIVNTLTKIAEKEQFDIEPEALHTIARKADGALRDALSLFDMLVTFSSGEKVTSRSVSEHLHILDDDYYFKMTDYLTAGDTAGALLLFDGIIAKGFDGHLFVVGYAEHLRNLIVCRENATVKIAELSEEDQKKYSERAAAVSISFLLSSLNILSLCDINYKERKNRRLHVELALLKIARIPEVLQFKTSSLPEGNVKKKSEERLNRANEELKPISKPNGSDLELPTDTLSTPPAAKYPVVGEPTEIISEPKNDLYKPQAIPEKANPPLKKETPTSWKETLKIPKSDSLVLDHVAPADEEKPTSPDSEAQRLEKPTKDDLGQLKKYCTEYGLAEREKGEINRFVIMNDPELSLTDEDILIIEVGNEVQQDQFPLFKEDLLRFIREKTGKAVNGIKPIIKERKREKPIYTATEKFHYLSSKYPLLQSLKDKLDLETDF